MGASVRRGLRALHRWLGAALSGMFVLWFGSGLVLVFAGFPRLDDQRRLQSLPELALDGGARSPAEVLGRRGGQVGPGGSGGGRRVRLGMLGSRPVYRVVDTRIDREGEGAGRDNDAEVVDARDGARVASGTDATLAWSLAEPFVAGARAPDGQPGGQPTGQLDGRAVATRLERRDQWTLTAPAAAQFPLVRLAVGDGARTEIFVSTRTAEVVQVTTRRTRTLAWLGAIPHWIYPVALRRHAGAWRWLVLTLATTGFGVCLSGLVLGLRPWRGWRPWRPGRRAAGAGQPAMLLPTRRRWLRWHHLLGLAFGGLAAGWVGSGALSLEPLSGGRGDLPPAADHTAFAGGPLDVARFVRRPADALEACQRHIRPRELELVQVAAHPFYLCRQSPTRTRLLDASRSSGEGGQGRLDVALALTAMRRIWPDAEVAPGGGDAGDVDVLRVVSPGAPGAEYQIDLRTGMLGARSSRATRFEQTAFRALHRLELPGLPAGTVRWYVTVVGFSLVGLAFSSTGLVLAVAWARRRAGGLPDKPAKPELLGGVTVRLVRR
jgi:hypothetical protein